MGKKSSKSKTTNEPPKWAVPALQGAMGTISNTVNANQGNLDQMAGQIRGFLPGLGQKAFGSNAGLDAATGYATDVLGGKYLNNNPYIDGMASLARSNTANDINSMFAKAGRVGSDAHFADLGRGMSEAELGLRYQNYGNERNAQTQAAGLMPGLNQSQYAGVMPYLAASQTAGQLPFSGIQNLGMLGSLAGGYGTQSSTQPGGWGGQVLGAVASAAPFIFSDRRLKKHIKKVGEYPNGLGKYQWIYTFDPAEAVCEGVMADEVKERFPEAYSEDARGYGMVNYAKLAEAA